ncbi:MAG: ribonuclease HIII [Verrucomicrobia bacterium]|nr:ribonuclease HIII [Verrucomicrobiota bacterium]
MQTTHTCALTLSQLQTLRAVLAARGWEFSERQYMHFFAQHGGVSVSAYEKGPKIVVQGKGVAEFLEFILEPQILLQAGAGGGEPGEKSGLQNVVPEEFEPHFGIDESGKGDFFGPLVIAGAYVDPEIARRWIQAGIQDSKLIKSDVRIRKLAGAILGTSQCVTSVVVIGPERYNELYRKFGNLNRLLAWGHARVIENLLEQRPDCPRALSDQFANPSLIRNALMERGRLIKLEQRTKAESDPAVAAASILARAAFIDWLANKAGSLGGPLPRGASAEVKAFGMKLVAEHGAGVLGGVAKLHFKTAAEILSVSSCTQGLPDLGKCD